MKNIKVVILILVGVMTLLSVSCGATSRENTAFEREGERDLYNENMDRIYGPSFGDDRSNRAVGIKELEAIFRNQPY